MRRNRLKHAAHVVCHMFCGWRLTNAFDNLKQLGSGLLVIDVLALQCRLNGEPIKVLSIADELHTWLLRDLRQHHIPVVSIRYSCRKRGDSCPDNLRHPRFPINRIGSLRLVVVVRLRRTKVRISQNTRLRDGHSGWNKRGV